MVETLFNFISQISKLLNADFKFCQYPVGAILPDSKLPTIIIIIIVAFLFLYSVIFVELSMRSC